MQPAGKAKGLAHIPELDGIRGLAALIVMFFHYFQHAPLTGGGVADVIQKFSTIGQTGVALFFVLSGFLITRILLETKSDPRYFGVFFARRALRIFPLYYLALCLVYFVLPRFTGHSSPPVSQQLIHWLYLQNFAMTFGWDWNGPAHFWSLAVEEHFYLLWPLVVYFLPPRRLAAFAIAIIVLAFACRVAFLFADIGTFFFTLTRMDALAFGALLAMRYESHGISASDRRWLVIAAGIVAAAAGGAWLVLGGMGVPGFGLIKYTLTDVLYLTLLALAVSAAPHSPGSRALRLRPLTYTGKISYGLYVFHPLVFEFLPRQPALGMNLAVLVAGFALTYLIASLSFFQFEARFLTLKKYFRYTPRAGAPGLPATNPT